MSKNKIDRIVSSYVSSKRAFFAGKMFMGLGIASLLLLMLTIFTDSMFFLPVAIRMGVVVTLGLVAVLAAVWYFILPSLRYREEEAIREIEDQAGEEIGQMLRTSVQMAHDRPDNTLTAAMSDVLIDKTEQQLAAVQIKRFIPWKSVVQRALVLLVIAGGFTTAAMLWGDFRTGLNRLVAGDEVTYTTVTAKAAAETYVEGETVRITALTEGKTVDKVVLHVREKGSTGWDRYDMLKDTDGKYIAQLGSDKITETFEFFAVAGDGESQVRKVRKKETPLILGVEATLDFPDYTRQKTVTVKGGNFEALEGTMVTLRFKMNHPLAKGRIMVGSMPLEFKVEGDDLVATFEMQQGETRYYLEGVDIDGLPVSKQEYDLRGLQDEPPTIELLTPGNDIEVSRLAEVPIRAVAHDDYGVAEMGLVIMIDDDDKGKRIMIHKFDKEIKLTARLLDKLMLEKFGLDITSSVIIYAFAKDGRGVLATSRGEEAFEAVSDMRCINIKPFKVRTRKKKPSSPKPGKPKEELIKLEEAIKEQRKLLRETFKILRRKIKDDVRMNKLVDDEEKLSEKVAKFVKSLEEKADEIPAEVIVSVTTALGNMEEAVETLNQREMSSSFRNETSALANLIRARQNLIQMIQEQDKKKKQENKNKEKSKSKKKNNENPAKIADELLRIAKEERAIYQEVSVKDMQKNRGVMLDNAGQHEEAYDAAGEVLEQLRFHKDGTELVVGKMEVIDSEMAAAHELFRQSKYDDAAVKVKSAERKLRELASHLKGFDENQLAKTLAEARDRANRAAANLRQSAGEPSGQSQSGQPKPGQPNAEQQQMQTNEAAQDAEVVRDWVDSLKGKDLDGRDGLRDRLNKVQEKTGLDELPSTIRDINKKRAKGNHKAANKQAIGSAKRLEQLAAQLNSEHKRVVSSMLEQLANAQQLTNDMKTQGKPSDQKSQGKGQQKGEGETKEGDPNAKSELKDKAQQGKDLASLLKDLKDEEAKRLSKELEKFINENPGKPIPKELLDRISKRLEKLISIIVEENMLKSVDATVPDKYTKLVERYFKALSDDLVEEE